MTSDQKPVLPYIIRNMVNLEYNKPYQILDQFDECFLAIEALERFAQVYRVVRLDNWLAGTFHHITTYIDGVQLYKVIAHGK